MEDREDKREGLSISLSFVHLVLAVRDLSSRNSVSPNEEGHFANRFKSFQRRGDTEE